MPGPALWLLLLAGQLVLLSVLGWRDLSRAAGGRRDLVPLLKQPGVPVGEVLARVLAPQQLLLVLDNCEHVMGAAAGLCAGLLAACDEVRVLATSREPLGVSGEARYRLGPLSLPGADDAAAGSEAVRLFADRARLADAGFALDDRSGPLVASIVQNGCASATNGQPTCISRSRNWAAH